MKWIKRPNPLLSRAITQKKERKTHKIYDNSFSIGVLRPFSTAAKFHYDEEEDYKRIDPHANPVNSHQDNN